MNPFDEKDRGLSTNPFEFDSPDRPRMGGSHTGTTMMDPNGMMEDNSNARIMKQNNLPNWLQKRNQNKDEIITPQEQQQSSYQQPEKPQLPQDKRGVGMFQNRRKSNQSVTSEEHAQQWPYDNYQEPTKSNVQNGESKKDDFTFDDNTRWFSEDKKKKKQQAFNSQNAKAATGVSDQLLERPGKLPLIHEAVKQLSLSDFESKAKERAINIIGKWLFDAGLIDELLVHGGLRSSTAAAPGTAGPGPSGATAADPNNNTTLMGGSSLKLDKQIEIFRQETQKELSLVNSRLNDGVAASGAEVQELVNAVSSTKNDLARLRELDLLLSVEEESERTGLLTHYPRLKQSMNARRNLNRCFRELDFFSQISSTCDRLRDELHSGEWTADEFYNLRKVCMEHVALEILLVEAEAGMKARVDNDGPMASELPSSKSRFRNSNNRRHRQRHYSQAPTNYEMVDRFLSQHVTNVWELGEEIRVKVMSGIETSFDLALNDPGGMVALVEAVEVYESATIRYIKTKKDADKNSLNFTNMRAEALSKLYEDFLTRCSEVFRAIRMQTANHATSDFDETNADDANNNFTAILRAANELVAEILIVKSQVAPCFAPHWHVEVLWTTCVAKVCSDEILEIIGGEDGHSLFNFAPTQLLDLTSWVEFFQETTKEVLPDITKNDSTRSGSQTDFNNSERSLFDGNTKNMVNMENANAMVSWVTNLLTKVHGLAVNEFLNRTRQQMDEWLNSVYESEHDKNQTSEGRLVTSLCEDVFSLAAVQLRTIRDRLSKKSDALVMAVVTVLTQLRFKQNQSRNIFLQDLETCCAAANDFQRMSERCEDIILELTEEGELSEDATVTLQSSSGDLLAVYSGDAVYAAQYTHVYIIKDIREELSDKLFLPEWEQDEENTMAQTLTQTLDDYMSDLETFLEDFMLKKTVDALINSSIVFYLHCLLQRAENHKSNKNPFFQDNQIALERMSGDLRIMREYFESVSECTPHLAKVVEEGFTTLRSVYELLVVAAGASDSDAGDFIPPLHKAIKDVNLTKHVIGDLWHLVAPAQERTMWELVENMENTLQNVADNTNHEIDRMTVPGIRLDEMMAKHYIDSKRKRPVKAGAVEKMVNNWKLTWSDQNPDTGG